MCRNRKIIPINEELFIGQGHDKVIFAHPFDDNLCIKILYNIDSNEWKDERRYRKILKKRGRVVKAIPEHIGYAVTTMGAGLIFEKVHDYDGQKSLSLADYIKSGASGEKFSVREIISEIKKTVFGEKIIISDSLPENFLIQKDSPEKFSIRVVDGLGSHAAIPLMYFFDIFESMYINSFWNHFIEKLGVRFPEIINDIAKI